MRHHGHTLSLIKKNARQHQPLRVFFHAPDRRNPTAANHPCPHIRSPANRRYMTRGTSPDCTRLHPAPHASALSRETALSPLSSRAATAAPNITRRLPANFPPSAPSTPRRRENVSNVSTVTNRKKNSTLARNTPSCPCTLLKPEKTPVNPAVTGVFLYAARPGTRHTPAHPPKHTTQTRQTPRKFRYNQHKPGKPASPTTAPRPRKPP